MTVRKLEPITVYVHSREFLLPPWSQDIGKLTAIRRWA